MSIPPDRFEELITWLDDEWGRRFPVRRTEGQKGLFLLELERELLSRQYETERVVTRSSLTVSRTLVTKCDRPWIIFTAHYDTPSIAPFWVHVVNKLFGHTRSYTGLVFLTIVLLIPLLVPFLSKDPIWTVINQVYSLCLLLSLVPSLFPNPHNRDDNSSGVIGLLALADWLKDKPTLREYVQFVFLDNEERGLLGAKGLKKRWDKQGHPYKDALIVNLDCISRGRQPLVVFHKWNAVARQLVPVLQNHLPGIKEHNLKRTPLSDNYVFRREAAVVISFFDPALIPGGFYIPRIHSPKDTDICRGNISLLVSGLSNVVNQTLARRAPV
jgi:hypothetical protein